MLQSVAAAHLIDGHELHVSTSIGVSVYPEDGVDAVTLIKNADTAMYQAKENGRRSFKFFKPAMNARAVERQSIEVNLRRALERREFELLYQPKINLGTGAITGAEALIRWMHPIRGLVAPADFIPIAEDCGLMVPIGNWALRAACEQARVWLDAGLPEISMAVNISAMEFHADGFLQNLFGILRGHGLESGLARTRVRRMRSHAACQFRSNHFGGPASERRATGDRRLRHGLLQFELSAKISCRFPQDRPFVHQRGRYGFWGLQAS